MQIDENLLEKEMNEVEDYIEEEENLEKESEAVDFSKEEEEETVDFSDLSSIKASDTVKNYLKEIGNIPLLTTEQEYEYSIRVKKGNDAKRRLLEIETDDQNNIAIEDVLEDFGNRSGIDDIKSFANVFKISYRKGGNIKDIIRNTHSILSDKMEIAEDIETMVTSNRLEQYIMIVMPIALIGVIKLMSPEFAANFVTPSGIISTTISIVIYVVAYFIGKSVLDIKI